MNIVRWDPFRELNILRDEMGRIFDQTFGRQQLMPVYGLGPKVDIYQTEAEVIVSAELPGLESKDDVEITVSEDTLSIKGRIKKSEERKEENYVHTERYYGTFQRMISLPAKIKPEQAKASYNNGILEIHLTKDTPEKHKKIELDFH